MRSADGMTTHAMPRQERGVTLLILTVALMAVIGVAGLALDLGMVYRDRARLQNALDAAAMSGAKTLSVTFSVEQTNEAALEAFSLNMGEGSAVVPIVETSATLLPFSPGSPNPRFVRVKAGPVDVPVKLIRALPGVADALQIAGTAVSGAVSVNGTLCDAIPVLLCGTAGDPDCSDGTCFGLGTPGEETQYTGHDSTLGPGNFGFADLGCGPGADCLRESLAGGTPLCFVEGGTITTEPGIVAGPASQGLNTRFGIYHGPVNQNTYPPDTVTDYDPLLEYPDYQGRLADEGTWNHSDGVPQRRTVLMPVIDCSTPIAGRQTVTVLGGVCAFLTRPMDGGGGGTLSAQLIGSCAGGGTIGGAPSGAYKIVLFQDPGDAQS